MIIQLWFAAVEAALSIGALPDNPRPPVRAPAKICAEIEVAAPVDPTDACPEWRHVAIKKNPDDACPDPGTANGEAWEFRHLFEASSTGVEAWTAKYAEALPSALRPFCLYEYKKNDPDSLNRLNRRLDRLLRSSPALLEGIDWTCAAAGPAQAATSTFLPETRPDFEKYFLEQVGYMDPVTVLAEEPHGSSPLVPGVRLSFLDTQPPGEKNRSEVTSEHGYSLAQMARKLLCDGDPEANQCLADIDYYLALPIVKFDRHNPMETEMDFVLGGLSGTIDTLATKVWDAVKTSTRSPEQRRVLNLSVAWNGEHFGGLEGEVSAMPVTVQAMYRALEVASCKGALVIAAAGNLKGGPAEEVGPLLPADWEDRDAPSPAACRRILERKPPRPTPVPEARELPRSVPASREPLLYAAGGVRFDNSPLYNSRPGGLPRLAAFADNAAVELSDGPMKALTGTSVAAAVISATASAVWHYRPRLSRAELMDLLYRAGTPIERPADFFHDSYSGFHGVRRVAVCPALKFACNELGGSCPFRCEEPPAERPNFCWTGESCSKTVDASRITKLLDAPFCKDREVYYNPKSGIPSDPCPSEQYYGATAWPWQESTKPQPADDPCSACGAAGGGTGSSTRLAGVGGCLTEGPRSLWIDIDEAWSTEEPLSQAFLEIDSHSLALGVGELKPGDCILIENIDFDNFSKSGRNPYVTLHFRTESGRSIIAPVSSF